MSKISEKKALEAYPKAPSPYYDDHILDRNVNCRAGYIKGYDQAMQDFMEKAEELLYFQLNNGSIECGNIEKLIEQFKNYMQDDTKI